MQSPRLIAPWLLVALALATPACRSGGSSSSDAGPATSSSAAGPKATPEQLAARAKAHCGRQDTWTKLESKDCQACMRGKGKGATECRPKSAPLRSCLQSLAGGSKTDVAPCVMACGKDCGCTMDCYKTGMSECFDPFLAQIDCVSAACDETCR